MNTTTKTCSKCKEEFPATLEYFHSKGFRNNKRRLHGKCKSCKNEYDRLKSVHKPRKPKLSNEELKIRKKEWKKKQYLKLKVKLANDPEFYKEHYAKKKEYYYEFKKRHNITDGRVSKFVKDKERTCKSCNNIYPNTTEYFEKDGILKNGKNKLSTTCKICKRPYYRKQSKKKVNNLTDAYVASIFNKSIKDIPSEILETKRLLIKIKRELKCQNQKKQSATQKS